MRKLVNESPYRTQTLKRIITTVAKNIEVVKGGGRANAFRPEWWATVTVTVKSGRRTKGWYWKWRTPTQLDVHVPGLTGAEFITHLREQHGGAVNDERHPALASDIVALAIQQAIYGHHQWARKRGLKNLLIGVLPKSVPKYLPIRIIRPKAERDPKQRDIITERADRVDELIAKWERKEKLAKTKLKKLRAKRRHYQKKLSHRSTNQEVA